MCAVLLVSVLCCIQLPFNNMKTFPGNLAHAGCLGLVLDPGKAASGAEGPTVLVHGCRNPPSGLENGEATDICQGKGFHSK